MNTERIIRIEYDENTKEWVAYKGIETSRGNTRTGAILGLKGLSWMNKVTVQWFLQGI